MKIVKIVREQNSGKVPRYFFKDWGNCIDIPQEGSFSGVANYPSVAGPSDWYPDPSRHYTKLYEFLLPNKGKSTGIVAKNRSWVISSYKEEFMLGWDVMILESFSKNINIWRLGIRTTIWVNPFWII